MKDRYVCNDESDIMCTTNAIMEDLLGVPEEITDDLRQELCLFFLQKKRICCVMQISSAEVYNLLSHVCRKYCEDTHRIPTQAYTMMLPDILTLHEPDET